MHIPKKLTHLTDILTLYSLRIKLALISRDKQIRPNNIQNDSSQFISFKHGQ